MGCHFAVCPFCGRRKIIYDAVAGSFSFDMTANTCMYHGDPRVFTCFGCGNGFPANQTLQLTTEAPRSSYTGASSIFMNPPAPYNPLEGGALFSVTYTDTPGGVAVSWITSTFHSGSLLRFNPSGTFRIGSVDYPAPYCGLIGIIRTHEDRQAGAYFITFTDNIVVTIGTDGIAHAYQAPHMSQIF